MQTILVIGGTGMLGLSAVRRLHADGYEVRVLSRSPARARVLLGESCAVVGGDVDDPSSLEAALQRRLDQHRAERQNCLLCKFEPGDHAPPEGKLADATITATAFKVSVVAPLMPGLAPC